MNLQNATAAVTTAVASSVAADDALYCLPLELEERWRKISSYNFDQSGLPASFAKRLALELDWTDKHCLLAINEYKKFMLLASQSPGNTVPAIDVDSVWHFHILHTRLYQDFCNSALDMKFLHHDPSSGSEEEEAGLKEMYRQTVARYKAIFGACPSEIWGAESEI